MENTDPAPLAQVNDSRAAATTVEALAFSLRAGVAALREKSTLARIAQLDKRQAKDIAERLQKERWSKDGARRAPVWAGDEVKAFLKVWRIAHER